MAIGLIFVVLGEIIRLWGVSYAGSETRTRSVGASNLVSQGPFAYTRNPLYLANIIIYFGFGIMANSLNPYLTIIGVTYFILQYHLIINEEEKRLLQLFKEKYEEYRSSVNRIIPSLKPLDAAKQSRLKLDFKSGYRSEKRTLQANLTVVACIYIVYILINQ
jgi:protein-S-isoprenylcysteine O-methyltransferase Ste14